jgi:hypothetical protein
MTLYNGFGARSWLSISILVFVLFLLSHGGAAVAQSYSTDKDVMDEASDEVIPLAQVFPEDWESGFNGWFADGGVWQVDEPTGGPGYAHSPTNCAGTVPAGFYPPLANSRLISPSINHSSIPTGWRALVELMALVFSEFR